MEQQTPKNHVKKVKINASMNVELESKLNLVRVDHAGEYLGVNSKTKKKETNESKTLPNGKKNRQT